MPPKLIEDAQHHLSVAKAPTSTDVILIPFFDACEKNDAVSAMQLAPKRDAGCLMWGLKKAVDAGYLDLASCLINFGATLDSFTAQNLSKSSDGVKWLLDSDYHLNTGLIGGGTLLS
jgi:hypothetical protein